MKKICLFLLFAFSLNGCSDDGFNNNNPYIPNFRFSTNINIDLPSFSALNFVGNSIYVPPQLGGSPGLIIFNSGSGYFAYDATCPNQPVTSCSTLTTNGGINVICPCDDESYSLFTGLSNLKYPLKRYRVEVSLPVLRVYN